MSWLPDPDKIYGKQQESSKEILNISKSEESEEESEKESEKESEEESEEESKIHRYAFQ